VSTALVLSAGGLWAAWEVGVWKALRNRFQPDLIVGASAGSWNGWAIAGGCTPEELEAEWLNPRTACLMEFAIHSTGCLRPDSLYQAARDLYDRYRPRVPFGLTTVEVPRLRLQIVRGAEVTWRHLAASCSIPLGFPPIEIDGRRYVDGGLLGGLPLYAAQELGATRAVALNVLTTLPFRILRRVLWTRQPAEALEVCRIEPSTRLGSLRDAMVWKAENIQQWIELGERDGERAAESSQFSSLSMRFS
jgi:NTE family protein